MKFFGQLLGISLLAPAVAFVLIAPPATVHASTLTIAPMCQHFYVVPPPGDDSDPAVTNYQGKIVLLNGRLFILRDTTNDTWYHLDDQKAAARFAGKNVVVIGVLDERSDVIRVRSIHESA